MSSDPTATIKQELAAMSAELANGGASRDPELESRMRRLEDAIASMQDQQSVEERMIERILHRVAPPANTRTRGLSDAATSGILPRIVESVAPDSPTVNIVKAASVAQQTASKWTILELGRDLADIWKMYFDVRFRVSRQAKLAPWVTLLIMVVSYLYFTYGTPFSIIPVVGPFIAAFMDKTLDIFLALFLYKMLSKKSARYRAEMALYP